MKTTGMIRRVDSLGRIVIPKEIRKVLKIKENEQVEIKVENDEIILNRYSELDDIDIFLNNIINILSSIYNIDILITDLNCFKNTTNNYLYLKNKDISNYLTNILNERSNVIEKNINKLYLNNNENEIDSCYVIKPLIINGDIIGLIIILSNSYDNIDYKMVNFLYEYLEKTLE